MILRWELVLTSDGLGIVPDAEKLGQLEQAERTPFQMFQVFQIERLDLLRRLMKGGKRYMSRSFHFSHS